MLWEKLTTICKISANAATNTPVIAEFEEEEDILNIFLNEELNMRNTYNDDVSTKIEKLNLPSTHSKTNVLDFWKEKKHSQPELYALSNICFGIPPTQV